MGRPLLSICIPTYNRAKILEESLASYVNDPDFDEDVEIVISDNCSTDNTKFVCEHYALNYENIKYYRNTENVHDVNFTLVMDRASGHYLKLMNDNVKMCGLGLKYLKNKVLEHISDETILFFTNGILFNHKREDSVECVSFEDFVLYVSFCVTGIGLFGAWKTDWDRIENKRKYADLKLCQDDWMYQMLEFKKRCILFTSDYKRNIGVGKRDGYNWFEIHVDNYYKILKPYVDKGLVSKSVLKREKWTNLKGIKTPIAMTCIFRYDPCWQFETSGALMILWRNFKELYSFYFFMMTIPIWGPLLLFKKMILKRK